MDDLASRALFAVDDRAWVREDASLCPPNGSRRLTSPGASWALASPSPHPRLASTSTTGGGRGFIRTRSSVRVALSHGQERDPPRAVVRGDVFDFVADPGFVWASRDADARGERPPVRIDADAMEVVDWPVTVNLTEFVPVARPPEDVDPVPPPHAEEQRRSWRALEPRVSPSTRSSSMGTSLTPN